MVQGHGAPQGSATIVHVGAGHYRAGLTVLCACSIMGQSLIGVGHHGAVPLMAHGHGVLWGHISPLDIDVGYCGAVPPMTPLWDIVVMSPMTLGYRTPGSRHKTPCSSATHSTWLKETMGHCHPMHTAMGHM